MCAARVGKGVPDPVWTTSEQDTLFVLLVRRKTGS
jgi:hypothetical protein